MKISFKGNSDRGSVRDLNEDSFSCFTLSNGKTYAFIVADGMGGANAGEVASKMAAEYFTDEMKKRYSGKMSDEEVASLLTDIITETNKKILEKSLRCRDCDGMGTTAVACVIRDDKIIAANVGDSRAYISVKSHMDTVTSDHSFVHEMFLSGAITAEEERKHPQKNILTRAVGAEKTVKVDTFIREFPKDAVLLMCTDGLSNMIENISIHRIIRRNKNMEKLADRLVAVAKQNGGNDNITVIVARRSDEVI